MTITNTDICRIRGDTFPFSLNITDGTSPVDVTGFNFVLTVDPSSEPLDASANVVQRPGVITSGPGGAVEFTLSTSDADQAPGEYYYDIQQTDGGGLVRTILGGKWEVLQDITK